MTIATHAEAQAAAERGIAQSAAHAERAHKEWVAEAAEALGWAATQIPAGTEFLIERLRQVIGDKLPSPPDLRSWGAATRRATAFGYIVKTDRVAPAASSNNAPKALYQRGVWQV